MQKITQNNFDFLRLSLAIIVFISHLGYLSQSEELAFLQIIPIDYFVFGFFVISGFLISQSYEKNTNLKNYFKKRINRIMPGYILIITISAVFLSFVSNYSLFDYFTNIKLYSYYFWNLILLNFMEPSLPGVFNNQAVNGALWTIKTEMAFYATIPILYYIFNKCKIISNNSLLLIFYILSI